MAEIEYNMAGVNGMAGFGGGTTPVDTNGFSFMQDLFGGTNANGESKMGYATAGLGTAKSLLQGYLGMKQYGLAKDQFQFSKNAFNKNFEQQKRLVNSQLADRQKLRHYERPDLNEDVATYMSKFGAK